MLLRLVVRKIKNDVVVHGVLLFDKAAFSHFFHTLKGRYREIFSKFFFAFSCRYRSTNNNPKRLLSKTFCSKKYELLKKHISKRFLCGRGFTSDVHGEQLLVYLMYLCGKVCAK